MVDEDLSPPKAPLPPLELIFLPASSTAWPVNSRASSNSSLVRLKTASLLRRASAQFGWQRAAPAALKRGAPERTSVFLAHAKCARRRRILPRLSTSGGPEMVDLLE